MSKTFQASNINCNNCSNLIKGSLEGEFGDISVNLEASPVEVSLNIEADKEEKFKAEMADLGFEVIGEK